MSTFEDFAIDEIGGLRDQIQRLETALGYAKEKLELYRAEHNDVYIGGIEYTALIRMIDAAFRRTR